ncbi:MAG: hypothetical protein HY023_15035 [Chloroflexi bacterium]|nr:hypothetical protein [Chloroflexota bacterium]
MPPASYLIFARKEYQKPLEWIGRLSAPANESVMTQAELRRRAREAFGDEGWVEMVAIPETAILRVIPMGQSQIPNPELQTSNP